MPAGVSVRRFNSFIGGPPSGSASMPTAHRAETTPSLVGTTIRRAIVLGRIYLVIGIAYCVVLTAVTSVSASSSSLAGVAVFLPVFAVVGAMGGMMVFTNDRLKGVLEYLLSYGFTPRRLFVNVLVASLVLASIVLGTALALGVGLSVAKGHPITVPLAELLGLYSIPMSYASVAFAETVGMFWTSLSSPRSGMTSSVGLVPILGIAPAVIVVIVLTAAHALALPGELAALAVVGIAVLLMLSLIGRLLPLERLLSPT